QSVSLVVHGYCPMPLIPDRFALFFFQAEDGIRDFHVTGVQTCALPISTRGQIVIPAHIRNKLGLKPGTKFAVYDLDGKVVLVPRSEERRVGKEWRPLWAS